jgi:hypothetical protein
MTDGIDGFMKWEVENEPIRSLHQGTHQIGILVQ